MSTTPTQEPGRSLFNPSGMAPEQATRVCELLQERLYALLDLTLTLKHIHWNVIGPSFIAVHEMLDVQVASARAFSDAVAERLATMGGEPQGTPGAIVAGRSWDDYGLRRAGTQAHLAALDMVYEGVISDHRKAIDELDELDPVTQDLFIAQTSQLELYQWFVRAHLEDSSGNMAHDGATSLRDAARRAES